MSIAQNAVRLSGYVVIERRVDDSTPIRVLGKKWTLNFEAAQTLASEQVGVVAARSWIARRTGSDPVATNRLREVEVPHVGKRGAR